MPLVKGGGAEACRSLGHPNCTGMGQGRTLGKERKQDLNPGSTAQMDDGSELMREEKTC